jgi:hypothetical protein
MNNKYTVVDSMGQMVGEFIPASTGSGCLPVLVIGWLLLWLCPFIGFVLALKRPASDPNRKVLVIIFAIWSVLQVFWICFLCSFSSFFPAIKELFS